MPTFNQGIRTNVGYDLFGKVQSGQTAIHYTKVVFSSLDLSNKSDDDIQQMTDVNPKELIVPNPQVLYKPKTNESDQETEIRAIGSNEILKSGFYIKTYALYAADDSGHEILYGVTADNNPSWLPAYDGVRPQALTYNWDTGDKDTNNVHFTDSHDEYATYGDYQAFSEAVGSQLNSAVNYTSSASNNVEQSLSHNTNSMDSMSASLKSITPFSVRPTQLSPGTSLNNVKKMGFYYVGQNTHCTDTPGDDLVGFGRMPGILEVISHDEPNVYQLLYSFWANQRFERYYENGQWLPWSLLPDNNDTRDAINSAKSELSSNILSTNNNLTNDINTSTKEAFNQANTYTDSKTNNLQSQINENNPYILRTHYQNGGGCDMNAHFDNGIYIYQSADLINAPASLLGYQDVILEVINPPGLFGWSLQRLYSGNINVSGGSYFFRFYYPGAWHDNWIEIDGHTVGYNATSWVK